MKHKLLVLFTLFLISPLIVFAEEMPMIEDLEANVNGNKVSFSGTTESGSHAVMCKLYNEEYEEIDMLSVAVDNNKFNGEFTITEIGYYTIICANYEGGEVIGSDIEFEEIVPATYTVTFDTTGGSVIDPITVEDGTKVTKPTDPTKEKYIFDGWYEDSTYTTPFDFEEAITRNRLVYAKWKVAPNTINTVFSGVGGTYTVSFDANGGEQGPLNTPTTTSASYIVPIDTDFTIKAEPAYGYTFKGWYSAREDNSKWVEDKLLSSNATYTFTPEDDLNIMPVFSPVDHTVTFNTNGGSTVGNKTVAHNEVVSIPDEPTKDGYTFAGWYADSTLTTEFDFNEPITDDTTLYAKWDELKKYSLKDEFGNEILFSEEDGHDFDFAMLDLTNLTEEEIDELTAGEFTKEEYDEALKILKEAVSDEGSFIAIYESLVTDENDAVKENGPFTIRIKKTEDMKKFNDFKILYVDTDNEFEVLETIKLTDKGDYLEGTLAHLSSYVLVGNNVSNNTNNAQTLDNIYIWIITLIISLIGLTGSIISTKKLQTKKSK